MADNELRKQLIRLAHERPEFREHILPLLQKQAGASYPLAQIRGNYVSFQDADNTTTNFGFEINVISTPDTNVAEVKEYLPNGRHMAMVEWDGKTLQLKFDV